MHGISWNLVSTSKKCHTELFVSGGDMLAESLINMNHKSDVKANSASAYCEVLVKAYCWW